MNRDALYFVPIAMLVLAMALAMSRLWSWLSGWPRLVAIYPDRPEQLSQTRLRYRYAQVGRLMRTGVTIGLTFGICPAGLRVAKSWPGGLFSPAIFVPWRELSTARRLGLGNLFGRIELLLGVPEQGRIEVSGRIARRIAEASHGALRLPPLD